MIPYARRERRKVRATWQGALGGELLNAQPVFSEVVEDERAAGVDSSSETGSSDFWAFERKATTVAGAQAYALKYLPISDSLHIFKSGLDLDEGVDFTVDWSNATVSFAAGSNIKVGDVLNFRYLTSGASTWVPYCAPFSDDFNRADQVLALPWYAPPGLSSEQMVVSGNKARKGYNDAAAEYAHVSLCDSDDFDITVDIHWDDNSISQNYRDDTQIKFKRSNKLGAGNNEGYIWATQPNYNAVGGGTSGSSLYYSDANGNNTLEYYTGMIGQMTPGVNHTVRMKVQGTTISIWLDGVMHTGYPRTLGHNLTGDAHRGLELMTTGPLTTFDNFMVTSPNVLFNPDLQVPDFGMDLYTEFAIDNFTIFSQRAANTAFLDDFNRLDGGPANGWTYDDAVSISGNKIITSANAKWLGRPRPFDSLTRADCQLGLSLPGGETVGHSLYVKVAELDDMWYFFTIDLVAFTPTIRATFNKGVNFSSPQQIGVGANFNMSRAGTWRLTYDGTTYTAKLGATTILTGTGT